MKSEIPAFRLVFFDPVEKAYKTVSTEPIALRMIPAPARAMEAAAQSLPVPLERMTDILALIRPAQLTLPTTQAPPTWLAHAIGGILALLLVAKAFWMRFAPRFNRSQEFKSVRASCWNSAAPNPPTTRIFSDWPAASSSVTSADPSPAIKAVLAERDAVCFRAEKPKSVLDHKRRSEILQLLRNSALLLVLVFTLGLASGARAQEVSKQATEAFDSAKYEDAIKLWLSAGNYDELSADTLYNIGNACYRAGSPGYAALYYRRALVRDSAHPEARQNLRFIERKYGSITVQRPDYQYALARFPLTWWKDTLWAGLWVVVSPCWFSPPPARALASAGSPSSHS